MVHLMEKFYFNSLQVKNKKGMFTVTTTFWNHMRDKGGKILGFGMGKKDFLQTFKKFIIIKNFIMFIF